MNEETKGDERERVIGRKRKTENGKSDYAVALLYVTPSSPQAFFYSSIVVVPTSQTKHVTRKRVFWYPMTHLLVLLVKLK